MFLRILTHRVENLWRRFSEWFDTNLVGTVSDDSLMTNGVLDQMPQPSAETPVGYQGNDPIRRVIWENGQAAIGYLLGETGTRRLSLARVLRVIGIPVSRKNARAVYSALQEFGFIRGYAKPANYREKRRFVLAAE